MATKFKMISEEDVKVIRAAKKALIRIVKKLRRLNAAEDDALGNSKKDYKSAALMCWRMLDEVEALGITVLNGSKISLRILPSGAEAEAIAL